MSWTYTFGANPPIDYVRLLIPDTDATKPIFQDEEIVSFTRIQQLQFQSSMFYTAPAGQNLPSSPVSYLRIAAMAIDVIASDRARLAVVESILDVKLSNAAVKLLMDKAAGYRQVDDESGAFVIIEQVKTNSDLLNRFWSQIQRQQGV